ncbi:MAG: class I SAM-dependent methyltransferase family protein [Planctomycetota bacterium]
MKVQVGKFFRGRPAAVVYAAVRLGLRTAGRASRGIDIGLTHGFDSGRSLDHIYTDRAAGRGPLGRWLDRRYLNAPGCRALRRRREHVGRLLRDAVSDVAAPGRLVRILDLASGPGRCSVDVLGGWPACPAVSVTLIDTAADDLNQAKQTATRFGLSDVTTYVGDAFDPALIHVVDPRPDVVVVSGFYELIDDDAAVSASLRSVAEALAPNGWLIHTGHPHHPQAELMARCLPSQRGGTCAYRRRSTAELDAMITAAGFAVRQTLADPGGIFTVSLARLGQ